jgi:hypothetical protein
MPNVAGNWQFNATAINPATAPVTIAGGIHQAGAAVNGRVHVDGSGCFDRQSTISVNGTLSGNKISLTSASVGGQVVKITGTVTNTSITGDYSIEGGCADGDQGSISASKVPLITSSVSGTFTAFGKAPFDLAFQLVQGNDDAAGTFGITGSATVSTPCFNSATLRAGVFPSGSYILGTSVALEIATNNGMVGFLGRMNPATGEIDGDYAVSGVTCDQTGTAVLSAIGNWDY